MRSKHRKDSPPVLKLVLSSEIQLGMQSQPWVGERGKRGKRDGPKFRGTNVKKNAARSKSFLVATIPRIKLEIRSRDPQGSGPGSKKLGVEVGRPLCLLHKKGRRAQLQNTQLQRLKGKLLAFRASFFDDVKGTESINPKLWERF